MDWGFSENYKGWQSFPAEQEVSGGEVKKRPDTQGIEAFYGKGNLAEIIFPENN